MTLGRERRVPAIVCVRLLGVLIFGSLSVQLALSRHFDCNESALSGVDPPFGSELLPDKAVLIERRRWFQLTRMIDVYEAGSDGSRSERVGSFYDMNFLFFKRFGYSDAHDRIWLEGRYQSFLSRLKPWHEYELRRCDARGGVFDINEHFLERSFFCFFNCKQSFTLARRDRHAAASVMFDSKLEWVGLNARHAWFMRVADQTDSGSELAVAQQRFSLGASQLRSSPGSCLFCALSHWTLHIWPPAARGESARLPRWALGFMAALDDLLHTHQK